MFSIYRVNYIRYALNLIVLKNISKEFKISPQFPKLEQLIYSVSYFRNST